jgi:hypothetical protein
MLNTVPLAERQQQLGAPIFTSLAPLLFRHACYPLGFTNWAECIDDDEEAFNRSGTHYIMAMVWAWLSAATLRQGK